MCVVALLKIGVLDASSALAPDKHVPYLVSACPVSPRIPTMLRS